ncbi:sialate O-acetylesterase [Draconibacterium sp. IB214405]|uniref:sialate O-acetylesterase n=1 Tax=Draconibacterium sp. IB214405 TaxID=3097352 RepID=UPI002A1708DB|nr:sialate O-acetylesterase [Draconibacterium sp. IB214405]MDX8341248.1 sialate O-acetylesterase [Draconibacterium sp. IB214405]
MTLKIKQLTGLIIVLLLTISVQAQVSLPYVFSDHMILQRESWIPVWGSAEPGAEVTLTFADQEVSTTVDESGQWKIHFAEIEAGGPYEMKIYEGENTDASITFQDVLIGDVWFASGQSNMEWQVQQADGADEEIPNAFNSQIRLFNVPHDISITPLENTLKTEWKVCDSTSVKEASAVAYYFAKKLQTTANIPIGILQSSWGGTPVEAWTSREMLLSEDVMRNKVLENDTVTEDHFVKDSLDLIKFWDIVYNPKNGMDTIIPKPNFKDKEWKTVTVPGNASEWEPEFYEGMIWLRKTIELDAQFVGKELTLNLGHPEMNYSLYFNGAEICKTQWNANLTHDYKIPAELVRKGENTIAYRMAALWGGGGINPPAEEIYLSNGSQKLSLTGEWKYKKDLEPAIPTIHNFQYYPTYLYNAMINPVVPYGLAGFIWYQGEANDSIAYDYRTLLPLMINDWRIRWQQGFLPFLWVQLPNYMDKDDEPADGKWAVMRESQTKSLELPNTGMACIIELGETNNIHPTNKTDVGNRLAAVAQKLVYNMDVQSSGPVLKDYSIIGNEIRIQFDKVAEGLSTSDGEPVIGFAIAGEDQKFYWAVAKIVGDEIVVSAKEVVNPVAVRYAWANNPDCNLVNSAGLPALPFRTDSWKVITQK